MRESVEKIFFLSSPSVVSSRKKEICYRFKFNMDTSKWSVAEYGRESERGSGKKEIN
jgi:hypothetical protein